jgi:hypothetical protein
METHFDILVVFHAMTVSQDGPSQGVNQNGQFLK